MRVRWLPRPDRPGISFLPLFHAQTCDFGANRTSFGMLPACVDACPTGALQFGDAADPDTQVHQAARNSRAVPLESQAPTRADVRYIGLEAWHPDAIHAGVELSPEDSDIIYEQGRHG